MKLVPAIIFFYMMIISSIVFQGIIPNSSDINYGITSKEGIQFQNNYGNTYTNSSYAFWELFFNPTKLSSNEIWAILAFSVLGTVVGIVVSLVAKSDLVILLTIFVVVFGAGAVALIPLYNLVYADSYAIGVATHTVNCEIDYNNYNNPYNPKCMPPILITAILVGTLAMYWFWVCMEWWSARSAT